LQDFYVYFDALGVFVQVTSLKFNKLLLR